MSLRIRSLLVFVLCLAINTGYPQYNTSFEIQDSGINVVVFEAQQVSSITLDNSLRSVFTFNSASEGSYKRDLYFDYEIKEDSLRIKSIYPKNLEFGDSKMSSMQEFSVSVNFNIPKNLKLIIDSDIASIKGSGIFRYLQLNTKSGNCTLTDFTGNANINTYDGRIYIKTRQARIEARSQTGDVTLEAALVENYQVKLRTVNGDVEVIQTN